MLCVLGTRALHRWITSSHNFSALPLTLAKIQMAPRKKLFLF